MTAAGNSTPHAVAASFHVMYHEGTGCNLKQVLSLPGNCLLLCCRLAVAAQDRQSVRYSTLHQTRQGAARLGAVANPSCAAGIAIDTKRVVHVRDLTQG